MKKILILIVFMSFFTSCKKDSSNPVATENDIVGTWVLTNISGITSQGSITILPSLVGISMTMVFKSDKTATLTMVQEGQTTNSSYNWSTLNGYISFTPTSGGVPMVLPYTINGNKVNVGFSSIIPSITYSGVTVTSLFFEFTKQ